MFLLKLPAIITIILIFTAEKPFAATDKPILIPIPKENENKDAPSQEKEISNQQLLEKIKNSIKPVDLHDDQDINIQYDFPAMDLSNPKTSSKNNINLNVLDQADKQAKQNDILDEAYQAYLIGQYEAAVVLYKKALSLHPQDINIQYALATIYHKLHQYKEAKSLYSKVLAVDPEYSQALNNYLVVFAEESPTKALIEFKELEKVNPNFSPVQAQIGMIYAKLGEYELAEKYIRKAVQLNPEILNYRYNLAVLYDKMHKYEEAIIIYKQLLAYNDMGEILPASTEYINSRLIYLTSLTQSQKQLNDKTY